MRPIMQIGPGNGNRVERVLSTEGPECDSLGIYNHEMVAAPILEQVAFAD